MSDEFTGLPYEETARLLKASGYDPNDVVVAGIDEEGYFSPVRDFSGNKVIRDEEVIYTRKFWVNAGFGERIIEATKRDLRHGAREKIEENSK